MAFLKYIGTSHFRVFRPEDFSRLGVEGVALVKWAKHEVVELMDDAADALMKHHGDEFEKTTAAPVDPQPAQPSTALHTDEADPSSTTE